MSLVWFTPESLFRVSTFGASASGADPWLVPGAHLRAWVAPAVGFPLHPFTFWPVRPDLLDQRGPIIVQVDVIWWVWDAGVATVVGQGGQIDVGKFRRFGPVYGDLVAATGHLAPSNFEPWFCWVGLAVENSTALRLDVVSLGPPGSERTLVSRSLEPYALGASHINRIRLTGDGGVTAVVGLDASRLDANSVDQANPTKFALPFDRDNAWYVGAEGAAVGVDRAGEAAPRQAGPPDRPDGPIALSAKDEISRIVAITAGSGGTGTRAEDLLQPAYGDPTTLPTRYRCHRDLEGKRQPARAEFGAVETLLVGAADAGLARWLGLAGVDDVAIDFGPKTPLAWISAGIWAVDPQAVVAGSPPVTVDQVLNAANVDRFAGFDSEAVKQWAQMLEQQYVGLEGRIADAENQGFKILTLIAPAGLGARPDLPAAPDLVLDGPGANGAGQWESLDQFSQRIRLRGPIPAGPVAFACTASGHTTSLHETVTTPGPTIADRALTLLAGRVPGPTGTEAVVTASGVPGATGPVTWRVAVADEFGRWGPQAQLLGDPPPRPPLPAPITEVFFTADPNRDTGSPPGQITVQVSVPPADQMAPGTLAIKTMNITVAGQTDNIDVTKLPAAPPEARLVIRQVPAPPTQVAQRIAVPVSVGFDDGDGGGSRTDTVVSVTDPRRPPPVATAPTLLWASRRDPTGQAELALIWPVGSGHDAYRVYVGEERALANGLGLAPPIPDGVSRAGRAQLIWENRQRLTIRNLFALATEQPIKPGADGLVRFAHRLPGSLRTIQFVRVVPLTADGVEAPFFQCGLVPIAVPDDDRPPTPSVSARPVGHVIQVEVTAGGLNPDLLNRLQPGGQALPEFRLRRVRGLVADTVYQPVVASGTMNPVPDQPGVYTVQQPDPATGTLPPFVRHTWVAEVRYPAEIAVPPGAVLVPSPLAADWAVAPPGTPQPSGWSAPSSPVSTMVVVPVPPITAVATKSPDGTVTLSVTELPVVHTDGVGPWRLHIWRRTADGAVSPLVPGDTAVTAIPDPGGQAGNVDSWVVSGPELNLSDRAGATTGFALVLVNPIGETGPLTNREAL